MKNTLKALADDIAIGLARELRSHQAGGEPAVPGVDDPFVSQIVQEVARRVGNVDSSLPSDRQVLLERLQQVESQLHQIASVVRSAFQEETTAGRTALVGEGSKYQNVEALLKYIQSPDGEGGIKLVIMNFND